jgi:hypothetical protein
MVCLGLLMSPSKGMVSTTFGCMGFHLEEFNGVFHRNNVREMYDGIYLQDINYVVCLDIR